MKTSWPRVESSVRRTFLAFHSLPQFGFSEQHMHEYQVLFGYCHEINPALGCARCSLRDLETEVDALVQRIAGKDLNVILPVTPTAEWLACWLLSNIGCDENRLSFSWDFVIVRTYGCFECRVDRNAITSEWQEKLRARAA